MKPDKPLLTSVSRSTLTSLLCACLLLAINAAASAQPAQPKEPNIIVIVADDLGFSDVGSFGGEIETPNIDKLALQGVRYTNFYVAASCSPTRSMLLTGRDNHVVGLGNMHEKTAPNQMGVKGYEGVLSTGYPTIAEVFQNHGYNTYMAGKWHLGHSPKTIPKGRGFDKSFSILNGAGSHFKMTGANTDNEESEYTLNDQYLKKLPRDHYSSKSFTDHLIQFIDQDLKEGKPFFGHLAFQAPHDPLQVPDDWLRKYKAKYDKGWDAIREERLARMKKLGIVPAHTQNAPRLWYVPEFDSLTGVAQVTQARRMEIYAAMVEYMDKEIGRLVSYLDDKGLLDNTYIIFFSDNGPNPNDPIQQAKKRAGVIMASNFYATDYKTSFEAWGRKDGFVAQSAPWAQVSATPFSGYKLTAFEGGLRSPLIVWHKASKQAGEINNQSIVHVSDLAPTVLDLAGITPSSLLINVKNDKLLGRSRAGLFTGDLSQEAAMEQFYATEMFGGRAYRQGDWKVTWMHAPFGTDEWQLFNLAQDPAELHDLSEQHPKIRAQLIKAFEAYAQANNVIIPDRTIYDGLEENLPPRPPVDSPEWPRGQEANWSNPTANSDKE